MFLSCVSPIMCAVPLFSAPLVVARKLADYGGSLKKLPRLIAFADSVAAFSWLFDSARLRSWETSAYGIADIT